MDARSSCAVVTGAATGIGRATALALARDGFGVVLVGRRAEPLEEVAGEVRAAGGDALPAPAEVTSSGAVAEAVRAAVDWRGGIDALGVGESGPLLEESLDNWERTLRINLTGAFLTTQQALPHLLSCPGALTAANYGSGSGGSDGWRRLVDSTGGPGISTVRPGTPHLAGTGRFKGPQTSPIWTSRPGTRRPDGRWSI